MKLLEAKAQMINGDEFKFVATLVPPMIAFAKIVEPPPSHLNMGRKLNLLKMDDSTDRDPPYEPIEPANFRTGTVLFDGTDINLDRPSDSFPDFYPSTSEFSTLLNGTIVFLASS